MMQALWSFDIGASCAEHQPHGFSHPIQVNAGLAQQDAPSTSPLNAGRAKLLRPPRRLTGPTSTALTFAVFVAASDYATLKRICTTH